MARAKHARFRMFAGPNGSGKSELFHYLRKNRLIHTELYVSADRIEKQLKESGAFHFNAYRIQSDPQEFEKHVRNHGLWKELGHTHTDEVVILKAGILKVMKATLNSYIASFVAAYLCSKLFASHQSFCFETVMSHPSKLEMFEESRQSNYKNYLYYVYTTNPDLNIARIHERARTGGHFVADDKVRERFLRSLQNLPEALRACDVTYIIDNTESDFKIIAEKREGEVIWHHPESQAFWKAKGIHLK